MNENALGFVVDARRIEYDRFAGEVRWRAWLHGVHVHLSTAAEGSLVGYGRTRAEAKEKLLRCAATHPVFPTLTCTSACPNYVNDLW